MKKPRISGVAAILLAGLALGATAQEKKGVTLPEMNYQAGTSPLATEPMVQSTNPKAPPMTLAEFDDGRKIYFERCAGCHGVLRKGATGKPLTPDITVGKGTEYLKVFIAYGSPAGMPNWQTSGEMTAAQVDIMARYIQHEPPTPPEWSMADMKASWKVMVAPKDRPTRKMNSYNVENIFSTTLGDTGEVALLNADRVLVRSYPAPAVACAASAQPARVLVAPAQRSFVVLFAGAGELWEISYDPQAEPILDLGKCEIPKRHVLPRKFGTARHSTLYSIAVHGTITLASRCGSAVQRRNRRRLRGSHGFSVLLNHG